MSSVEPRLRPAPRARAPFVDRIAFRVLGHELANLEGGTLQVRLPDGTKRSFGSGPAVYMYIHDGRLFRRLANRPKLGLGESYTAGEWDCDDLVGFFQLLIEDAAAATQRNTFLRRVVEARPRPNRRNGLLRARRNISYHYDLGNELFALMLDTTKLGAGGPLGSGRQWWSWIHLDDAVKAIEHILETRPEEPLNIVAPEPVRQRDLAHALGRALHRPAVLPTPAFMLRAVLDGFAAELPSSRRVSGQALASSGFVHRFGDLDSAFADLTHD